MAKLEQIQETDSRVGHPCGLCNEPMKSGDTPAYVPVSKDKMRLCHMECAAPNGVTFREIWEQEHERGEHEQIQMGLCRLCQDRSGDTGRDRES